MNNFDIIECTCAWIISWVVFIAIVKILAKLKNL